MAWMSVIFFNRNAKDRWAKKRWLPNVPHLANLVRISNAFPFTEKCYEEVVYLGRVSGYTFDKFLRELNVPGETRGFCAANPINIEDPSDGSSNDKSDFSATNYTSSDPVSDRRSLEVGLSMSDASDGMTTDVEESEGSGRVQDGAESGDHCVCDVATSVSYCSCE